MTVPTFGRAAVALAFVICLLAQRPVAQSPQTTFRVATDLVPISASVLDRNRRPVRGLLASDFVVEIDGRAVPISAFSEVSVPDALDPVPNAEPAQSSSPDSRLTGRLVAIVMDRTIPAGPPVASAMRVAHAAIDSLARADLAAVFRTSEFAGDGEETAFLSDREALRSAASSPFMGSTEPEFGPRDPSGECPCGICTLSAIESIVRSMAKHEDRQKIVIFIGSSISISEASIGIREMPSCRDHVPAARDSLMRALDDGQVTMHSVDPRGLLSLAEGRSMGRVNSSRLSLGGQQRDTEMQRQNDLGVMPAYSGGRSVLSTNSPERYVPGILAESQSYYILGVERPSQRGRLKVRVRVRGANAEVQARTSLLVD